MNRKFPSSAANHFLFAPQPLRKAAPYIILILAVIAAYSNAFGNAFLYDDESLILKNLFLRDWSHLGAIFTSSVTAGASIAGGFYRPLQILLYLFVYQLAGPSTFAYHLLNVALHVANACLLYLLGRKLRFNPAAVFSATLIWALHPMHVEAVAYISSTADMLFTSFVLLGINVMVPRFKPRQILLAIPFFILALLSKEEAVCFPLLAANCLFLIDAQRFKLKTYVRLWPLVVVAVLYVVYHELFLNLGGFALYRESDIYANSVICRIMTCLATLPSYLGFLLWPVHLHFDRDFRPVTDPWNFSVLAGAGMVGIAGAQLVLGRSRRALAFSWGLLWFAIAHVLHTGILRPVNAVLLEHWMYLPSAGLLLGAAQSLASVKWQRKHRKPVEMALLVITAITLGALTYRQTAVWANAESLYLNIFKNGEPSPHAHNNLGVIYALDGRYEQSIEQFELAIQLSGDANPQSQHDLAIVLLNTPHGEEYTQEAMNHLQRALEIDPDYFPAAEALAELYSRQGIDDEADYYRNLAAASRTKILGQ